LKVGALDFETECALLAAVRAEHGPDAVEIRVDANGAFSPTDAPTKLARLADFALHSIEQPLKPNQRTALANLCATSPLPIALDEELIGLKTRAEKQALLDQVRPHALVVKPTLVGGLAAADEWAELADAMSIDWWANSALESNIGLNAIAQWISARRPDRVQGLGTGQLYTNNLSAPIRLEGIGLIYDNEQSWDLSPIFTEPNHVAHP
jgi:L-alanine-DL-glutamate epimerase-like enolase superfamily enzyme